MTKRRVCFNTLFLVHNAKLGILLEYVDEPLPDQRYQLRWNSCFRLPGYKISSERNLEGVIEMKRELTLSENVKIFKGQLREYIRASSAGHAVRPFKQVTSK